MKIKIKVSKQSWTKFVDFFTPQFPSSTSKSELDYYHHKVHVQVASRVTEPLNTGNLRILGNFKKIPEKLLIESKSTSDQPKAKFRQLC